MYPSCTAEINPAGLICYLAWASDPVMSAAGMHELIHACLHSEQLIKMAKQGKRGGTYLVLKARDEDDGDDLAWRCPISFFVCVLPFLCSLGPLFLSLFLFYFFFLVPLLVFFSLFFPVFLFIRFSFFLFLSPAKVDFLCIYRDPPSLPQPTSLLLISMAGELVSSKDSDTNSPATIGLLVIGFDPNSSCALRETWLV